MKSKNSGVRKNKDKEENPFLINDPDSVWQEWKKKGKPISRRELQVKIKEAAKLQEGPKERK